MCRCLLVYERAIRCYATHYVMPDAFQTIPGQSQMTPNSVIGGYRVNVVFVQLITKCNFSTYIFWTATFNILHAVVYISMLGSFPLSGYNVSLCPLAFSREHSIRLENAAVLKAIFQSGLISNKAIMKYVCISFKP